MDIVKYWKYFKYIVEHKKNVFIECWKNGLYIHAFTHDLSKFRPSEFITYANFFYKSEGYEKSYKDKESFQYGWCLHQKRNKHHWNYWVIVDGKNKIKPVPMPFKYIKQMICDWKGMSRKFGDNWIDYYEKNKDNFILHENTEVEINSIIAEKIIK